jgi:hypothetical protein
MAAEMTAMTPQMRSWVQDLFEVLRQDPQALFMMQRLDRSQADWEADKAYAVAKVKEAWGGSPPGVVGTSWDEAVAKMAERSPLIDFGLLPSLDWVQLALGGVLGYAVGSTFGGR